MAIQVRCPNADCGKMLSVRDDFAGKTGKCPNCGTTMPIPYPGADPHAEPPRAALADEDIPVRSLGGRRRRDDDFDDYDDRGGPRRRSRYDDDDDDEPPRGRRRPGGSVATPVCLSVGVALLLFLSLTPLFSMYAIVLPPNEMFIGPAPAAVASMFQLTEGKILLIVSVVVALLCLGAIILYLAAPERVSGTFITVSCCVAGGWGLTTLFWQLGFVWDIFTTSSYVQQANLGRDARLAPGIGLWLGFVLSMGVVAAFAVVISLRGKVLWLYLGDGLGVIAGILLLTLNVQPWDASNKVPAEEARRNQSALLKTKFGTRYWPLAADFQSEKTRIEDEARRNREWQKNMRPGMPGGR